MIELNGLCELPELRGLCELCASVVICEFNACRSVVGPFYTTMYQLKFHKENDFVPTNGFGNVPIKVLTRAFSKKMIL